MKELPDANQEKEKQIQLFLELINTQDEYNRKMGIGSMLGNFMAGSLEAEEDMLSPEQRLVMEKIKMVDEKGSSIGLGYVFSKNQGSMIATDNGLTKYGDIALLNITNPEVFLDVLKKIDAHDLDDNEGLLRNRLERVFLVIVRELQSTDNQQRTDNRWSAVADFANQYSQTLEHLGLVDSATRIKRFAQNRERGTLAEYLVLEDAGGLELPDWQTPGPRHWHGDEDPEGYRKKLKTLLDVIQLSKGNPRALDVVLEAVNNVLECAAAAIEEMEKVQGDIREGRKKNEWYFEKNYPKFLKTARDYMGRLESMKTKLSTARVRNAN